MILRSLSTPWGYRPRPQLAKDTGLTREDLYQALSSKGNPSFYTVAKAAKALGFKLTVRPLA